jgi:hypothetical protein
MMRKPLRKKKTTQPRPGRKPKKSTADVIADMAAAGLVEDEIAQRLGVHKNFLRAQHIDSIKAGKAAAAVSEAGMQALTIEEYHFLDVVSDSFSSHWFDDSHGNLLFAGVDGGCAHSIEDAYAAWKQRGGRYNVTGRSTRFNKEKAIEFAKIASDYRNKFETR